MTTKYMIVGDNCVVKVSHCDRAAAELEAELRHAATGIVQRVVDAVGDLVYVSVGPVE